MGACLQGIRVTLTDLPSLSGEHTLLNVPKRWLHSDRPARLRKAAPVRTGQKPNAGREMKTGVRIQIRNRRHRLLLVEDDLFC